ncbi:MAG: hypothetical protein H0W62_04605 [Chitinophagales bacterium]|nr:hypothetical protein [Chitinophagales bacterium]
MKYSSGINISFLSRCFVRSFSSCVFFLFFAVNAFCQYPDYTDSTITIAASDKYHAEFLGKVLLGNHYRNIWSAPVTLHYLDMGVDAGGLTPLKRGGGLQTKSLRLMGADSNQYVIRTIDKDPSKTVSHIFQNTIITDLIQDQISASHPYAPLAVSKLADYAGIYHTNPQILYMPDDPRLGKFRNDFKNRMVLYEVRELNSQDVGQGPGELKKIISTFDLYDKMQKSSDNRIDSRFVLRSRLFDMWIGDWDRHEDQWRWAEFKSETGKLFRPIPRDRDQAFFTFDGLLPTYASLDVAATRKMQRFRPMPVSISWFNYNARFFDRAFLPSLNREDWKEVADSLMTAISDENINDAFKTWPDTIYKLSAPRIINVLKERRNNLPVMADKYYAFLARQVDVVGCDKDDYYEIKRSEPNVTDVSVYQYMNGEKGDLTFHRIFNAKETEELRLYGLGGNDVFNISGKADKTSLLRIIGGKGMDSIIDHSTAGGFGKRTRIYDSREGNFISLNNDAANKTSDDTLLNTYNRKELNYTFNGLNPAFGFNIDDGVFLGVSIARTTYGFKKFPYQSKQIFSGGLAFRTVAYNFKYRGDFTDVIGKMNFVVSADVQAPNFRQNFFGYGNETPQDSEFQYYRLRINQIFLFPSFELGSGKLHFLIGPLYQQAKLRPDNTDKVIDALPFLQEQVNKRRNYLGFNTELEFQKFDRDTLPHIGFGFFMNTGSLFELNGTSINFGFLRGSVALTYTFYKPFRLTIATRFGGGHNVGDFAFYQSNNIGGRNTVRGFRGERYSGRSALYNNLEARVKLFHFNAYIFPADIGILGLVDNGRVWIDGESSDKIHTSYGGGLWISPFGLAVLTITDSFSDEQPNGLLNIKLGWWF